jgi:hypothetical protein
MVPWTRFGVILELGEDVCIVAHRPGLKNGFGLPENSVRSAMVIADEPYKTVQAPSGAAWGLTLPTQS